MAESQYLQLLAVMCKPVSAINILQNIQGKAPDELVLFNLAVQHGVTALVTQAPSIVETDRFNMFHQKTNAFNKHKIIATHSFDSGALTLLKTLVAQKIPFVVLKGFALARTAYPKPSMRTKADIDLLIAEQDVAQVKQIFSQQGYFNPRGWEPKTIINQFSQRKILSENLNVDFDVHIKISNNKRLENILSLEQLLEHSLTHKETGGQLVGFVHAMLHAIFHLMNHRHHGDLIKLIWYYDIYLLSEKLDEHEIKYFLQLINTSGLAKVTIKALELTTEYFDSTAIHHIIAVLDPATATAEFDSLMHINDKSTLLLESFTNHSSLKQKWLLIKETAFPPPAEIYAKYGRETKQPLMLLYIRRIWGGVIKHFK